MSYRFKKLDTQQKLNKACRLEGGEAAVREEFCIARANYIDQKLGRDKRLHSPLLTLLTTADHVAKTSMKLRGADYDIIPEAVFKQFVGKTFAQSQVTPITVDRPCGGQVIGVSRYATSWNPPPGCFRVQFEEATEILKQSRLADSHTAIMTDEALEPSEKTSECEVESQY